MRAILVAAPIVVVTLVLIAITGGGSTPALASFHEMRIYGVMGGADGSDNAQFVELRLASPGQTQVQNAQLCFYDAGGFPWARFVFPNSVSSGASNSSILIGSQAMEDAWDAGAQLDFTFSAANTTAFNGSADVTAPIPAPAGAIVFEPKTDTSCGSPAPIDSIAYGTGYTGVAFFGSVFAQDLPTDGGGHQLGQTPVAFPPTNNAAEYDAVDCIVARNNSGSAGTVGGDCGPVSTPTPTPAPTASPAVSPTFTPGLATPTPTSAPSGPIMGDADCDEDVDADDGLLVLEESGGVGEIGCPGPANVNCDDANGATDALGIFRFVAGILTPVDDCTPIGQPIER